MFRCVCEWNIYCSSIFIPYYSQPLSYIYKDVIFEPINLFSYFIKILFWSSWCKCANSCYRRIASVSYKSWKKERRDNEKPFQEFQQHDKHAILLTNTMKYSAHTVLRHWIHAHFCRVARSHTSSVALHTLMHLRTCGCICTEVKARVEFVPSLVRNRSAQVPVKSRGRDSVAALRIPRAFVLSVCIQYPPRVGGYVRFFKSSINEHLFDKTWITVQSYEHVAKVIRG